MPHVPGIGGFVGQMAPSLLPPLAVRAQRLSISNSVKLNTCLLPTYAIGDLLVIQFICMAGLIVSAPVFNGGNANGWTEASGIGFSGTSTCRFCGCYWKFATSTAETQVTWSVSASSDPDQSANAIAIIGADPKKAPSFSNSNRGSTTQTSEDHSGGWIDAVPVGPTLYGFMGGLSASAVVTAYPAEFPDNRLNNVAGTCRPYQATRKSLTGGAVDPGPITHASAVNGFQMFGAMGDQ
jgi:hypothetical protein